MSMKAARLEQVCSLKQIRELSSSSATPLERCRVWVRSVLFPLEQRPLSFSPFFFLAFLDFLFQKLYNVREKTKIFSVHLFATH